MQDDLLFAFLTPREALTFSARLKLNKSIEDQDKLISKLLKDLGLTQVADMPIGSIMKKVLSGGERKRTAIGVELITNPKVLILDEPTNELLNFSKNQL